MLGYSVVSDSLQPHELQPSRLLYPWDSPGKNTGVGCHAHLQGIFLTQGSNLHLTSLALAGGFFTTKRPLEAPITNKCTQLLFLPLACKPLAGRNFLNSFPFCFCLPSPTLFLSIFNSKQQTKMG